MQEKYWRYMVQVKARLFYLDMYEENSYKLDKYINMISAIAASSSIGAWVIWQQLSFLWSIIIAISQVINAIKIFLPYSTRRKVTISFLGDLKLLYNKIEYNWFKVSDGELTEEEINEMIFTFKDEYTNIENKNLKEETLPENERFVKIAAQKTDQYFENNF